MEREKAIETMHTKRNEMSIKVGNFYKGISSVLAILVVLELVAIVLLYKKQTINIPYVVEISRDGDVKYNKDAASKLANWSPSTATKIKTACDFITNLREISWDEYIQIERIKNIYAFCVENALKEAENYLLETDPLSKIGKERVEVNIYASSPLIDENENIFQIDWNEKTYSAANALIREQNYRAIVKTKHFLPKTQDTQSVNPLGIYITDLKITNIKDGFVYDAK